MEFLHSFLKRHSAGKPPVASRCVGCFLRRQEPQICKRSLPLRAWPLPLRSTLPFLLFRAPATYIGRRKLPFLIRELLIFMLSLSLKVQTDPEEVKQRDLWVTDFIPMQNIYKLALALTSKEIGNLIYQSFCTM